MVRFGFCGCGAFVERAVVPMLQRLDNASVEAVFDSNTAAVERLSSQFNVGQVCGSYEELLGNPNIDVVYVASPNVFHKEQSIAASRAGKHVFCQKPLALNTADCKEMVAAAAESGKRMGVGFCYRFGGAQQVVKRLIDDGTLGNISFVHMSFNAGGFANAPSWRINPVMSGGGALMDIAPHMVDLARYLISRKATSVMAYVEPEMTETQIEMDAAAMLDCGDCRVAIDTSFLRLNVHNYTIIGDKGQVQATATMSWMAGGKLKLQIEGKESDLEFPMYEHIEEEMRQFCQAIETGQEVPVPGEAGVYAQAAIDAIYESGKTGQRVQIPGC